MAQAFSLCFSGSNRVFRTLLERVSADLVQVEITDAEDAQSTLWEVRESEDLPPSGSGRGFERRWLTMLRSQILRSCERVAFLHS